MYMEDNIPYAKVINTIAPNYNRIISCIEDKNGFYIFGDEIGYIILIKVVHKRKNTISGELLREETEDSVVLETTNTSKISDWCIMTISKGNDDIYISCDGIGSVITFKFCQRSGKPILQILSTISISDT